MNGWMRVRSEVMWAFAFLYRYRSEEKKVAEWSVSETWYRYEIALSTTNVLILRPKTVISKLKVTNTNELCPYKN